MSRCCSGVEWSLQCCRPWWSTIPALPQRYTFFQPDLDLLLSLSIYIGIQGIGTGVMTSWGWETSR